MAISTKWKGILAIALQDLGLENLTIIHPGSAQFPLTEKITACGLEAFVAQEILF